MHWRPSAESRRQLYGRVATLFEETPVAVATEGQRHLKGWADVVDCLHIVATTQLHVAHMCHSITSKWTYLSVTIPEICRFTEAAQTTELLATLTWTHCPEHPLIGAWWQLPVCLSGLSSSTLNSSHNMTQAGPVPVVVIHYSFCLIAIQLHFRLYCILLFSTCEIIPCVWKLVYNFHSQTRHWNRLRQISEQFTIGLCTSVYVFMEHSIGLKAWKRRSHDHHVTLTSSTLLNVGSKCGCACNPVEHQPEQCSPVRYKCRFGRLWDTPLTGESASGGGEEWERQQGGGVGEGAGEGGGEEEVH